MPSSFSPSLRVELIGDGEQAGSWGQTTNSNLGTVLEAAIAGYTAITTSTAKQALTVSNGAADQARSAMLALNTSTGANFEVYAPPVSKLYVVLNLSATHTATVYNSTSVGNTTAAGAGVAVPPGGKYLLMTNGTDVRLVGEVSSASNVANTLVRRDANGDFAAGEITADLVGDVTGNLTGNVTGDVTGNLTGDVTGNLTGNVTGNTSGSAGSLATTNWTVTQSGTAIVFSFNGTRRFTVDSSGNLTVSGNVSAYGSV